MTRRVIGSKEGTRSQQWAVGPSTAFTGDGE
eukprot:CAMPEP_0182945996 /NCGR_PEP_ID=MMETSP0105_2-20130417/56367_1 /TAXON_ID=81532 ORGANISM="Acanthoeca-like sp., Strain 10tr" /NCGR_SAMPLE_ID=MMETSP0105_2 /ASSEMBLY_ACC=CAM_ASM_000205 /LENGTH=30 /DNA_ID= /DNA_START= /DNA_END= /DNA_ORIENTATION=